MGKTVIRIENISKQYQLGEVVASSLTQELNIFWNKLTGNSDKLLKIHEKQRSGSHLALDDVSFDIQEGDAVGIIGKNGAGKSTLLKILSRVTTPTKGNIKVRGRIASLLEVGTGFNPELTGRENIFLNGAILGMTKAEIKSKFDEIIDFSGVEKYIDTPVKRYSSGMYVRLAFGVAAHLEPEILIVDEVLAVGDSVFQKKCIDKMTQVAKEGSTVLFVSHNIQSIRSLCTKGIFLENGRLKYQGDIVGATELYVGEFTQSTMVNDLTTCKRYDGKGDLIFEKLILDKAPFNFGETIKFKIKLKSNIQKTYKDIDFGLNIFDKNGVNMIHISNRFISQNFDHADDSIYYNFEIENIIKPGRYSVYLFLRAEDLIQDWIFDALTLDIEGDNPYDFNDAKQIQGIIAPNFRIF